MAVRVVKRTIGTRKREKREVVPNEVSLSTLTQEVVGVVIALAFIAGVFASLP